LKFNYKSTAIPDKKNSRCIGTGRDAFLLHLSTEGRGRRGGLENRKIENRELEKQ
jgi:hypothetical protein